jgi:hypothetical protein
MPFRSGSDSSTLSLFVKHDTSTPFVKDPCVGFFFFFFFVDIELSKLLRSCENLQCKSYPVALRPDAVYRQTACISLTSGPIAKKNSDPASGTSGGHLTPVV